MKKYKCIQAELGIGVEVEFDSLASCVAVGNDLNDIVHILDEALTAMKEQIDNSVSAEDAARPISEEEKEEYRYCLEMELFNVYDCACDGEFEGRELVFMKNEVEALLKYINRTSEIRVGGKELLKDFSEEEKEKIEIVLDLPIRDAVHYSGYHIYNSVNFSILNKKREDVLKFISKKIELDILEAEALLEYRRSSAT